MTMNTCQKAALFIAALLSGLFLIGVNYVQAFS